VIGGNPDRCFCRREEQAAQDGDGGTESKLTSEDEKTEFASVGPGKETRQAADYFADAPPLTPARINYQRTEGYQNHRGGVQSSPCPLLV
jgi:hypothetical protein